MPGTLKVELMGESRFLMRATKPVALKSPMRFVYDNGRRNASIVQSSASSFDPVWLTTLS